MFDLDTSELLDTFELTVIDCELEPLLLFCIECDGWIDIEAVSELEKLGEAEELGEADTLGEAEGLGEKDGFSEIDEFIEVPGDIEPCDVPDCVESIVLDETSDTVNTLVTEELTETDAE
jgi:hypothetical protein